MPDPGQSILFCADGNAEVGWPGTGRFEVLTGPLNRALQDQYLPPGVMQPGVYILNAYATASRGKSPE